MLESSRNVVWITPLINRSAEGDVHELGAGGGGGDLIQTHELELLDSQAGQRLIELCTSQIEDSTLLATTVDLIENTLGSSKKSVALNVQDLPVNEHVMSLEKLAWLLSRVASQENSLQRRKKSLLPGLNRTKSRGPASTDILFHSEDDASRHIVRHRALREDWPLTVA